MDEKIIKIDFFGLITQLCESMLQKYSDENVRKHYSNKMINKLRTTAFEIFLKKCPKSLETSNNKTEDTDPVLELLKYSFVLKTIMRSPSTAEELENLLDELMDITEGDENYSHIKSVLYFLSCLKNYQGPEQDSLDIFYFGNKHPALPENYDDDNDIPHYQIYPATAFILPQKINQMIDANHHDFTQVYSDVPFRFSTNLQLQIAKFSMTSYTFQNLKSIEEIESEYYPDYLNTAIEPPWYYQEVKCEELDPHDAASCLNESVESLDNDIYSLSLSQNDCILTWETLGYPELAKPSPFILESKDALEYLINYENLSIDASEMYIQDKAPIFITISKFRENIKLVLLGIESNCFVWNKKYGFVLQQNITIHGLSIESIISLTFDIIHWATCFKLLSLLVRPQPRCGKFRQNGLIFKAMCNSIDDILIHYQASVLQVFNNEHNELLGLLDRLKPLGNLISEVARLCRCDRVQQTVLAEGTGILSHIYNQVTKKTQPNVALVYYSVLKSCCEVYFQLLEKWIFEGICDEAYGEFMIKIRSEYLRDRGHKFWSKCFGVNNDAVPGFLKNVTDLILQCGKTVRLLQICDPKSPLCSLFIMSRPIMKVCLSVQMLSEQEEMCQNYISKGMEILGSNVTVSSYLRELKAIEKAKADHVIAIQYETLQRIKKDREEAKLLIVKNKRKLLAEQKKQVEDAIMRREKAKEADLAADKIILEKQLVKEEEIKANQRVEMQVTIDYYKELAEEAKKQRSRAIWRTKRMKIFDERLNIIKSTCQDEINVVFEKEVLGKYTNNSEQIDNANNISSPNININLIKYTNVSDNLTSANKDDSSNKTHNIETEKKNRPNVLPVKAQDTVIESILHEIDDRNPSFKKTRTHFCFNSNTLINDKDSNTDNSLLNSITDNINDNRNLNMFVLNDESTNKSVNNNEDHIDNKHIRTSTSSSQDNESVNNDGTNVADNHSSHLVGDLNDVTPMSCTTDSYVPSAMSGSVIYNGTEAGSLVSKNDFETPTTPGDYLSGRNTENVVDIFFSRSNSQFFSVTALHNVNNPPVFESSLSKADVEMIDNTSLQVYLEKSVLIPLRVQSRLANSAIVKVLLYDHKILLHLQSLRSFFFLLNGEFAKNLTSPLYSKFYDASKPYELFNSATLTNLLENALHCSLNSSYTNSELLSLTATDVPAHLMILDPEALNCLCLHYKITWPLNIILDKALMKQYSKVFRFLLMIGRVLWVLQDEFCILKNQRKAALSYQYHRVQLFRHAMMQFMTALHNYLTCSVLHSSWAEFEKDLENAMTIDQIYSIHVSYIKKILSRCMLTNRGAKLRNCLGQIYQIILKFHDCLRSHEWIKTSKGYIHPSYTKLEKMYQAFCTMRSYPAQVVDKYASTGYQMYITRFVDALNMNPLFNL